MGYREPQNPGLSGLDEFTPAEESFLTSFAGTAFTQGSVIFIGASGALAQNNANFFWNNTSNFLHVPTLVGGTAGGSNITYKSTTGAGTTAGIAHQFVGGTDGATTAMTVLNNGNVGIGTVSPGYKLEVVGDSRITQNLTVGSASEARTFTVRGIDPIIYLNSFGGSESQLKFDGGVSFKLTDGTTNFLTVFNSGSGNDVDINARNDSAADIGFNTGGARRMTVTYTGNVGIGTTAPGAKLDVGGVFTVNGTTGGIAGGSGAGSFNIAALSTSNGNITVTPYGASGGVYLNYGGTAGNGGTHIFDGSTTERVTILNNGSVGIGTTGPGYKLHLSTANADGITISRDSNTVASGDYEQLLFTSRISDYGNAIRSITTAATGFALNPRLAFLTQDTGTSVISSGMTEKMTILSSGNVGIGTTGPGAKLTVKGDYTGNQALFSNDGSNGLFISAAGASSHNNWLIGQQYNIGGLEFTPSTAVGGTTFSTPKMVILNSGNVGIGTAEPGYKLEIVANAISMALRGTAAGQSTGLAFLDGGASPTKYNWLAASSYNASDTFEFTPSTVAGGTTFSTPTMTLLRTGNVGIGTTSPTARLMIAAGTATANTAPLKFTSGVLNTTAEAGAMEFLTDDFYLTRTTNAVRSKIVTTTTGRATGQTVANASVQTYANGASDASFEVSANVLITTTSAENFAVTVAYTDEGNTPRTLTLPFSTLAGASVAVVNFANGAVPYAGNSLHIRVKASTTITVATTGTFTGATYLVESIIKKT